MTAQTETKTADQTADRLNDIQLADAVVQLKGRLPDSVHALRIIVDTVAEFL